MPILALTIYSLGFAYFAEIYSIVGYGWNAVFAGLLVFALGVKELLK